MEYIYLKDSNGQYTVLDSNGQYYGTFPSVAAVMQKYPNARLDSYQQSQADIGIDASTGRSTTPGQGSLNVGSNPGDADYDPSSGYNNAAQNSDYFLGLNNGSIDVNIGGYRLNSGLSGGIGRTFGEAGFAPNRQNLLGDAGDLFGDSLLGRTASGGLGGGVVGASNVLVSDLLSASDLGMSPELYKIVLGGLQGASGATLSGADMNGILRAAGSGAAQGVGEDALIGTLTGLGLDPTTAREFSQGAVRGGQSLASGNSPGQAGIDSVLYGRTPAFLDGLGGGNVDRFGLGGFSYLPEIGFGGLIPRISGNAPSGGLPGISLDTPDVGGIDVGSVDLGTPDVTLTSPDVAWDPFSVTGGDLGLDPGLDYTLPDGYGAPDLTIDPLPEITVQDVLDTEPVDPLQAFLASFSGGAGGAPALPPELFEPTKRGAFSPFDPLALDDSYLGRLNQKWSY